MGGGGGGQLNALHSNLPFNSMENAFFLFG